MMLGKVRYVGKSMFNYLIDGQVYPVVDITDIDGRIMLSVIDGDDDSYLYDLNNPHNIMNPELCGKWELVESYSDKLTQLFEDLN